MTKEFYFPDVTFKELTQTSPREWLPSWARLPDRRVERISFDDATRLYTQTLESINSAIGARLTSEKRNFRFIPDKEMASLPETLDLAQSYGSTDIKGICTWQEDGSFDIAIGYEGKSVINNATDVLLLMGHEHGHTLGSHIPDQVLEEVKASAFQHLYSKVLFPEKNFHIDGNYADRVHDVASNMLRQLLDRGFRSEAILATLTGENFGTYRPDSNVPLP